MPLCGCLSCFRTDSDEEFRPENDRKEDEVEVASKSDEHSFVNDAYEHSEDVRNDLKLKSVSDGKSLLWTSVLNQLADLFDDLKSVDDGRGEEEENGRNDRDSSMAWAFRFLRPVPVQLANEENQSPVGVKSASQGDSPLVVEIDTLRKDCSSSSCSSEDDDEVEAQIYTLVGMNTLRKDSSSPSEDTIEDVQIDQKLPLPKDFTKSEILSSSPKIPSSPAATSSFSKMSNIVPSIGKPAPAFKGTAVVNGEFKQISLSDYAGKYVILFFYPMDFTFVCPTELIAFSDRAREFRNIGCELIACSTDSQFSHLAWINSSRREGGLGNMDIPLLADKSLSISKSYGVLKEDDGIDYRGLFVIDSHQILRQITINDLPVGRDVDETLRLVQAFQFTDRHGEVCPAGWRPGAKTMKADPIGSKEYFEAAN